MSTSYYGFVRVRYPLERGRMVMRTEQDWGRDVEPVSVSSDGQRFDFLLTHSWPSLWCKPCIRDGDRLHWATGGNKFVVLSRAPQDVYPHFFSGEDGEVTDLVERPSGVLDHRVRIRLYLPPGYRENQLKRYPVLYMQDGRNLFLPDEAYQGVEWQVDENLDLLGTMSLIDRMIVVGIHAGDRMAEYTRPGYERYARMLAEELKPWVDSNHRTLRDPQSTAIMGSSLGGVASFYSAWQHPDVFGNVGCLSSAFGYRDDLFERVRNDPAEPRAGLRMYLDSGWPHDNYEVTLAMVSALLERGMIYGRNLRHLAFPLAKHGEAAWSSRLHIPLQLFTGKSRKSADRYSLPRAMAAEEAMAELAEAAAAGGTGTDARASLRSTDRPLIVDASGAGAPCASS